MARQRRSASRDESQERLCDFIDRRLGFDRHPIEVISPTRLRAQRQKGGRQERAEPRNLAQPCDESPVLSLT